MNLSNYESAVMWKRKFPNQIGSAVNKKHQFRAIVYDFSKFIRNTEFESLRCMSFLILKEINKSLGKSSCFYDKKGEKQPQIFWDIYVAYGYLD